LDTLAFFSKILPSRGHYFVATLQQGKDRPWFRHYLCDSREQAAEMALRLDTSGENVYYACNSFREPFVMVPDKATGEPKKRERIQDNVLLARSFWMDLDVGDAAGKYPTQRDAIIGLGEFLKAASLPLPMVISSGYGLHCYWPLTEDILATRWVTTARMLKDATREYGLLVDHSRTADSASVLRPVGTFNKKNNTAKLVEVVRDVAPLRYQDLHGLIESACRKKGVAPRTVPTADSALSPNAKFLVSSDYPESQASLVADRCQQVRSMRDTGGNISEPVWYGAIQVLFHTVESEQVIHAWSSGYNGYSYDETQKKIDQIRHMGPTTCKTFLERCADGCVGCPFKGKITSPIQLGVQVKALAAPVVMQSDGITSAPVEVPNPPKPYIRSKDGIYAEIEAGVPLKIFSYDFYLSEIVNDQHATSRAATAHYKLPHDDPESFPLPLNVTGSVADLDKYLRSNGMIPENPKLMAAYVTAYLRELQARTKTRKLVQAMGWTDDFEAFVIGRKIFHRDGTVSETTLSQKFGSAAAGFVPRGNVQDWANATLMLGRPGMEAHAFSLLLGFGSPLLKFTGHHGVIFSLLGVSGGGKTSMLNWITSIWGDPARLPIGQNDTELAKLERIGSFNNLPITIDEASNWEGAIVSNLAYTITRGEGRKRLRQDATERPSASWNTFLVVSTNQALQSKLEANKGDSLAEQVRVFEFEIDVKDGMHEDWRAVKTMLETTYGVAGEVYAAYIVKHSAELKDRLRGLEDVLMKRAGCTGQERFWVAGIACAILGGAIAQGLGLIKFDVNAVFAWAVNQLKRARTALSDGFADEVTLLGAYLDEFAGNRVVVNTKQADGFKQVDALERLKASQLYQRLELDTQTMYVNRAHIKKEMIKRHIDFNRFKKALTMRGILTDPDGRKVLGAGTGYVTVQVPVWVLNLKHPSLSGIIEGAKQ